MTSAVTNNNNNNNNNNNDDDDHSTASRTRFIKIDDELKVSKFDIAAVLIALAGIAVLGICRVAWGIVDILVSYMRAQYPTLNMFSFASTFRDVSFVSLIGIMTMLTIEETVRTNRNHWTVRTGLVFACLLALFPVLSIH